MTKRIKKTTLIKPNYDPSTKEYADYLEGLSMAIVRKPGFIARVFSFLLQLIFNLPKHPPLVVQYLDIAHIFHYGDTSSSAYNLGLRDAQAHLLRYMSKSEVEETTQTMAGWPEDKGYFQ